MTTPSFVLPPQVRDDEGNERRVGLEIEFGGVGVPEAAQLVRRIYGGTLVEESRFRFLIQRTRLGEFCIELDSNALKARRHHAMLPDAVADAVDVTLERVARNWIPVEIGAPPVLITQLHELEELRRGLFALHAQGTRASLLYAFGFQLNPDLPSRRAPSLLSHLRAYLVLADWIAAVSAIDLTRKMSSFIEPFPETYRRRVLDPSYAPDLDVLIDDYLCDNPTRNRALDMLPAFCLLRPATRGKGLPRSWTWLTLRQRSTEQWFERAEQEPIPKWPSWITGRASAGICGLRIARAARVESRALGRRPRRVGRCRFGR